MLKNPIRLPPAPLNSCIGILGGSFDPPHLGHELLALSYLALEPIDELWIVPCANHAHKASLNAFAHRFKMCKLAFSRLRRVRIVDIENRLPSPNFTIQTLQAIKSLRPDLKLLWGLGSDLISSFSSWHDAENLSKFAEFVIFERENYPFDPLPSLLEQARLHRGFILPDTNSTELRDFLSRHKALRECPFMDRLVLAYIQRYKLYEQG